MKLSELLSSIIANELTGDDSKVITGLTADSRQAGPGMMFVAVPGPLADGHDYIPAALAAGCTAVVCERMPAEPDGTVTWIVVPDAAVAMGTLASRWYGDPSRELTLVGVTGTNGKTTIATLLYEMARLTGRKAGLLSTVENRVDTEVFPAHNTTPGPMEINSLLRRMVDAGCTFAAMEVSSHGLVQKRTAGLHFAGGIFTNITRDHLDYHKTMANYIAAKKSFFDKLPSTAWALTNADDPNGAVMLQNTAAGKYTYSLHRPADFHTRVIESRIDSTLLDVNGTEVLTRFTGRFNAYNLTAVYGASVLCGLDPGEAAVALSSLVPVAGRFQTFHSADGVTAVVDYAHTPDAIANVLDSILEVTGTKNKVTVVTGAGGNRDHGKRPMMGKEAAARCSRLIITSDNPRDEEPEDIADDIKAGVPVDSDARVDIILERAAAIHVAITEAAAGTVVLIAGKGHEDYQEFEHKRRVHFDDREQARQALAARALTD